MLASSLWFLLPHPLSSGTAGPSPTLGFFTQDQNVSSQMQTRFFILKNEHVHPPAYCNKVRESCPHAIPPPLTQALLTANRSESEGESHQQQWLRCLQGWEPCFHKVLNIIKVIFLVVHGTGSWRPQARQSVTWLLSWIQLCDKRWFSNVREKKRDM